MTHDGDTLKLALPNGVQLVPRDELKLRMDVYSEGILLRGYDTGVTWTRFVSADEIASAFTRHLGFASGLLPPDTLWWKQTGAGNVVALWREPKVYKVDLRREAFATPERLLLPMPGLVFLCSPFRPPWVFAAKTRPASEAQELYKAPTFNVFSSGAVCAGSHRFPEIVDQVPESFFQSFFSLTGDANHRSRNHPENLLDLWEELNGQPEFPLEDLVEQCTVAEAMGLPERPPRPRFTVR